MWPSAGAAGSSGRKGGTGFECAPQRECSNWIWKVPTAPEEMSPLPGGGRVEGVSGKKSGMKEGNARRGCGVGDISVSYLAFITLGGGLDAAFGKLLPQNENLLLAQLQLHFQRLRRQGLEKNTEVRIPQPFPKSSSGRKRGSHLVVLLLLLQQHSLPPLETFRIFVKIASRYSYGVFRLV